MTLNMAPGIGKGINIAGFDEHGRANSSKEAWNEKVRRRAAKTDEEKAQREREKDFDAIWRGCWTYYNAMVGKKKFIAQDGTQLKSWHYGSLLYNRFLQMAESKQKLHFRLSDFKMPKSRKQRPVENLDLVLLARLGDQDNLTAARKQLEAMELVKFGNGKVDYTVTILNAPSIRGKKRPLSKATRELGYVSALASNFHLNDRTEDLYSAILDEG